MESLYWLFWILVTLILYFMTAGMFCRILFPINRDDWWLTLAEVLVGIKENMILNPPPDRIFQNVMSVMIINVYLESVAGLQVPLHGCWEGSAHLYKIYNHASSAFEYVFKHIFLWWLAHLFSHKKVISEQQQLQLKSSWHLSGSPWHTKHKWFLVMECAAVFLIWNPRLVYCMSFTAMEPYYSYRESRTREYRSNWWPIYSVSWVSLDYHTSGLELILFKVYSCLQAAFFQSSSDLIINILG